MGLLLSEKPHLEIPKMDFSDNIKNIYNITLYNHNEPLFNFKLSNYTTFLNMPTFFNLTFQNISVPCEQWRCRFQPESYAIQTFPEDIVIKTQFNEYFCLTSPSKLFILAQILFLFILSNFAALYVRFTVWAAPMLLPLQALCQNIDVNRYVNAMPNFQGYWDNSNKRWMMISFLGIWIIFYFLYVSGSFFISSLLVDKPYPTYYLESISSMILIFEFLNYFFIRSRASMLFFP